MLISLHIENIAVIKTADIDFTAGFTVLNRRDRSRKVDNNRFDSPDTRREAV